MLGAAGGERLFWATTGPFAYHRVAGGASGVDRNRADLQNQSEVTTSYDAGAGPTFCSLYQANYDGS